MRLFISYASVDKWICELIVNILDSHEIWYDRRLQAGQVWWDEILRRLDWCEGFVYLLSPESVKSEYCQKEFEVAQAAGKHLFPVLIQARTPIPNALNHIHYADLSSGLNHESTKVLLDAILVAERQSYARQTLAVKDLTITKTRGPKIDSSELALETLLVDIDRLMDTDNYDQAVFKLRQLLEKTSLPRSITVALESMLREAEEKLEWQAYIKEAEREYRPLVALVRGKHTQDHGCEAFQDFQQRFPQYDPENLAKICSKFVAPLFIKLIDKMPDIQGVLPLPFEWCYVSSGWVTIDDASKRGGSEGGSFEISSFYISKYPITNEQYRVFLTEKDGYIELQWWDYSEQARQWRMTHSAGQQEAFEGDDLPRTNISWYDAVAYCRWLSRRSGQDIVLPTEQQWQRAAQGDDERKYPWGNNEPDETFCNFNQRLLGTTPVSQYKKGISPFGVMDLAGNAWEWCLTEWGSDSSELKGTVWGRKRWNNEVAPRVLRGGSWYYSNLSLHTTSRYRDFPNTISNSYGFRIAWCPPSISINL